MSSSTHDRHVVICVMDILVVDAAVSKMEGSKMAGYA